MSHFAVLVIGDDIEKQLAPYQENNMGDCPKEYLVFNDTEDEYREEYENGTRKEFFCDSSSSWGLKIPEKSWKELSDKNIIHISKEFFGRVGLYKGIGSKYRVYYELKEFKNSRNNVYENDLKFPWVELLEETSTDYIFVKIKPPKEIPLKEFYPESFEKFIEDWAGYKERDPEKDRYGYWENPNKTWDWYQIGGRYSGRLHIKTTPPLLLRGDVEGLTPGEIDNLILLYTKNKTKFDKIVKKYGAKESIIRKIVEDSLNTASDNTAPLVEVKRGKNLG